MYNTYSNQTYAYVNGIEGAKAYQVYPNQTMLLMDSEKPVFYFKSSNAIGQTSIKAFKFEEIDINATQPQYALKSDIEEIKSQLKELIKNG